MPLAVSATRRIDSPFPSMSCERNTAAVVPPLCCASQALSDALACRGRERGDARCASSHPSQRFPGYRRMRSRACRSFRSSSGSRATTTPPPDRLDEGDLERLRGEDRFREANRLAAWIEVEDGTIVGHGYDGTGLVGSTTLSLGVTDITIPGVAFEVLRNEPEALENGVRFVQTVGGRAGFPAPRRVVGRPFVRIQSATAWTTLALTIRTDGSSKHELLGASTFPRHWIYDGGRKPRRQVRNDRLQGLVPGGAGRANAMGRRGVRRLRHGRRERARARDLARADGGQDDHGAAHPRAGRDARRAGRARRRALPRPRRRARRRDRRRGGRRDRAWRDRRREGAPRGRHTNSDDPRADALPRSR